MVQAKFFPYVSLYISEDKLNRVWLPICMELFSFLPWAAMNFTSYNTKSQNMNHQGKKCRGLKDASI